MKKVIIFGGTTEGRELAGFCARYQVPALICVASEYGQGLLPGHPCLGIHTGKLNEEAMLTLIGRHRPELVIDATHPYAGVVTDTVSHVCQALHIPCIRVLRGAASRKHDPKKSGGTITTVSDAAAAAAFLKHTTGNILLTTGSKELLLFMQIPDSRERIYARVLPESRIMADCERLGIKGSRLIGMQGPFSSAMNRALLEQTRAGWLVTKESGPAGGFIEKIQAAESLGVSVVVIGRPRREQGISIEAAQKMLIPYGILPPARLYLIGMGMGGGRQLTIEGREALLQCQVVLGAKRLLTDAAPWITEKPTVWIYRGEDILSWVLAHPEYDCIGVVYSGDTGFYSASQSLLKAIGTAGNLSRELIVHICPGISTVSGLCARLKKSWEDVALASLHGRDGDVLQLLAGHRRVFLLLGGGQPLRPLCRLLIEHGYDKVRMAAGERLGYPDERILEGTPGQLLNVSTDTLIAVLLEQEEMNER